MSRVRIIWNQGDAVFTGHKAIRQLNALIHAANIPVPLTLGQSQWKQAAVIATELRKARYLGAPSQLYIYREPRRVREKKSKYKTMLRTLGLERLFPRGTRRRIEVRPYQPRATHPKQKRPSRIVAMLEQELIRKVDGDF